jgi:hypothetical protein
VPLIRYEVTLSPDAQKHPTAFAPIPASTIAFFSAAQAQGWTVTGQPGTRRIPAPYSDVGVPSGPGSPLPGGGGGAGGTGSRYMPPAWYPSLYYARQQLWGAIGSVAAGYLLSGRGGPSPVRTYPAVPTTVQPGFRAWGVRQLGQQQVAMDPNLPKYRHWRFGRG